jgi:prepilin peptidase CpaA
MAAEFLVLIVLPAMLAIAAASDVISFTIPNILQLALSAAFVMFAIAAGLGVTPFLQHLLAGCLGLAFGFVLFARGYIGGGDAKLLAACALWLGFHDLIAYAVVTGLCGGMLALAVLAIRRWPLPIALMRQSWAARLHDPENGLPYGVALAAGMLLVLPHSAIFGLATHAQTGLH